MRVMPQKLVSNYSCKSGEKVEFDLLHFRDSNDFVLCIDGFTSFRALKKKKDAEDIALILLRPILKRTVLKGKCVFLLRRSKTKVVFII